MINEENFTRWIHEDNLVNQRLTWLLTSQTIMFSAYGLILQFGGSEISCEENRHYQLLKVIIFLGMTTSALIFLGIIAAAIVLRKIWIKELSNNANSTHKCNYDKQKSSDEEKILDIKPNHYSEDITWVSFYGGLLPPVFIPILFFFSWVYLIYTN